MFRIFLFLTDFACIEIFARMSKRNAMCASLESNGKFQPSGTSFDIIYYIDRGPMKIK